MHWSQWSVTIIISLKSISHLQRAKRRIACFLGARLGTYLSIGVRLVLLARVRIVWWRWRGRRDRPERRRLWGGSWSWSRRVWRGGLAGAAGGERGRRRGGGRWGARESSYAQLVRSEYDGSVGHLPQQMNAETCIQRTHAAVPPQLNRHVAQQRPLAGRCLAQPRPHHLCTYMNNACRPSKLCTSTWST